MEPRLRRGVGKALPRQVFFFAGSRAIFFRMATIGKHNRLAAVRRTQHGVYLDGGELGEILLPSRYLGREIAPGEKLDVFIYLDSEDRLVATTETPRAVVGEFACLKVVSIHPRVGAFLDWGLSKDLLLPFREQEAPVRVGDQVVVYVSVDPRTQRIMASSRLNRHLNRDTPSYADGQRVNLLVTGETPLGYSAIVENAHLGLLYRDRVGVPLAVGQAIKGFVRTIRPGGKIDLSLDASGYQRVASLQQRIVSALEDNGGRLPFDDASSPEAIRQAFDTSKKSFKQALGALYKRRRIRFLNPGIELLHNADWAPGHRE